MAKSNFGCTADKKFTDAMQAALKLEEVGIVEHASYLWNVAKVVKDADTLIINMANYIANN